MSKLPPHQKLIDAEQAEWNFGSTVADTYFLVPIRPRW